MAIMETVADDTNRADSKDLLILQNYINGTLVDPKSGGFIDNFCPATGRVYGKVPDSGVEDVEEAVACAKQAFQR